MKNTHGRVLLVVKLQTEDCNLTKSNIPPWVYFTFFKLHKRYQIAQSITYFYQNILKITWEQIRVWLGPSMISFNLYISFLCDLLQCCTLIAHKDIVPTSVRVNDFVSFLFSKNCSSPKDRRLRNDLKYFIQNVFQQKRSYIMTRYTNLPFTVLNWNTFSRKIIATEINPLNASPTQWECVWPFCGVGT